MISLQRRVLSVTLGLIFGTIVLCGLAVYLIASASLQRNLDNSILQLARTEIASATDTGTLHVHETGPRTLNVSGVPGYEKFVWIEDQNGRSLASTSNVNASAVVLGADPFRKSAARGKTTFGDFTINDRPIRAVFYPFRDMNDRPAIGIVGVPSDVVRNTSAQIAEVVLLAGTLCLIVAGVIAVVLAKSVTGPIRELAGQVQRVNPTDEKQPQLVEAPYEEMSTLVDAFNFLVVRVKDMLSEREQTIQGQRQFVADASHELRTPVSNLQGTIEVALRRPRTDAEYRKVLQTSLAEVHRMSRLVQDLLALAKSDLGEFKVQLVNCDLVQLIQSAVESIGSIDVELEIDLPSQCMAKVDPDRMRQAIDNLIRNAVAHATRKVQVVLLSEGEVCRIGISNDGPQIYADDVTQIFDRFYRLDHSRARDTGGSGLGLPIAKAILEGHKGNILVESGQTQTTFWLQFPQV